MRIENRTFPETVRILAERAGVVLQEQSKEERERQRRQKTDREKLWQISEIAAGYFQKELAAKPKAAMEELEARGVSKESVEKFRLGYAPMGWDGLASYIADRGYSIADALAAGLIAPRKQEGGGFYDKFRHRLMFTIADPQGRVAGFSGRALPFPEGSQDALKAANKETASAKYINSSESLVYKKSEMLFGLHEARVALRQEGVAILCEGNFDVVAISQAGFEHVVAPLGTALTHEQCQLLRRFVAEVVVCFDADAAGKKATQVACAMLAKAGLSGKSLRLPAGDDPDSFIRKHGKAAFEERLKSAGNLVESIIDDVAHEVGQDTALKAKKATELLSLIKEVPNDIERGLYEDHLKNKLGLSQWGSKTSGVRRSAQPQRVLHGSSPSSVRPSWQPEKMPTMHPLELEVLGACLDHPELLGLPKTQQVMPMIQATQIKDALDWMQSEGMNAHKLLGLTTGDLNVWISGRMAQEPLEKAHAQQRLEQASQRLFSDWVLREQKRLGTAILEARRAGDDEKAEALSARRDELFRQLKA